MFLKMSIYLLGLFDGIQHRAQDMQLVPVEAPVAGPWNQIQDGGGAQQNQPGVQNNEEAHTHIYIYIIADNIYYFADDIHYLNILSF